MKYLKLFGITTLLICLFACGQKRQENAQANRSSEWETIKGENYTIQYPSDWDLNKSGQMGNENVNVVIQDLTGHPINGHWNSFSEKTNIL
jgi:hypothetical protein